MVVVAVVGVVEWVGERQSPFTNKHKMDGNSLPSSYLKRWREPMFHPLTPSKDVHSMLSDEAMEWMDAEMD